MEPQLRDFFQRLLHQAIHAAVHSIFWKMPLLVAFVLLAIMIGVVVYFQLY